MKNKDSIVLHHSGDSSTRDQFYNIFHYHNSGAGGQWPPGNGCSYHYVLEFSGAVKVGRPEDSVGFHAGSDFWNEKSIGICLTGNFLHNAPSSAQIRSLTKLITEIQMRWGIPDTEIYLHKEVRPLPTSCPGIDLRRLFLVEKAKVQAERIPKLINALKWARGLRRNMLIRLIDRLSKLL